LAGAPAGRRVGPEVLPPTRGKGQTVRVNVTLRRGLTPALVIGLVLAVVAGGAAVHRDSQPDRFVRPPAPPAPPTPAPPAPPPFQGWSDPARVGSPYGDAVAGLLTFRGNPTRTYYGTGPIPRSRPVERWRYPAAGGLCSDTVVRGETQHWCGTGWTGQPAVFERAGRTWVVFGAYDAAVHFLDAATGEPILPAFQTGDLIKGSVTVDPDGFPLVYFGSRDDNYRVLGFDREQPVELWRLRADDVSPTLWDNDWDSAGLVIDDYLFIGGENSVFHIVKLNRGYDQDGRVTVDPELVFHAPGWDDQVLRDFGLTQMAIESSVAIYRDVVYFANSGGLVQGWDISGLADGREPRRVFRFWAGDDIDATVVVDEQGALYVGVEHERGNARSEQLGQMLKLDPGRPGDPLVWSVHDRDRRLPSGIWGTPALHRDVVIFGTNGGEVLGLDRADGAERWRLRLSGPVWQSPVVVDDVLLIGDCAGELHAYDLAGPQAPPAHRWSFRIGGGCIESTPAVWQGVVYVGTRAGAFHAIGLPGR
jgi:outer membrane protein assembly factor BamB